MYVRAQAPGLLRAPGRGEVPPGQRGAHDRLYYNIL